MAGRPRGRKAESKAGAEDPYAFRPEIAQTNYQRMPAKGPSVPPFLLMVHPERWTVMEGSEGPVVVPQCGKFKFASGVQQVRLLPGGRYESAAGLETMRRKGWTEIPLDVDGEGTSYVRTLGAVGRPDIHVTRFERGKFNSDRISSDSKAYADWLAALVAAGKVQAPDPDVLQSMLDDASQRVLQILSDERTQPALRPEREAYERQVAALQQAVANAAA